MNLSPIKVRQDHSFSLNDRDSYRKSQKIQMSMAESRLSPSKQSKRISSESKSQKKSPNKSFSFKPSDAIKGKALPISFVIQNMIKPIHQQPLNPYWKQTSQTQLIQILSDQIKHKRFLQKLQNESSWMANDGKYLNTILTLLLSKVRQNNPNIVKDKSQFRIEFDRMEELQNQKKIKELRQEIESKEKQIVLVEKGYEEVVANLVETIQEIKRYEEFDNQIFQDSEY